MFLLDHPKYFANKNGDSAEPYLTPKSSAKITVTPSIVGLPFNNRIGGKNGDCIVWSNEMRYL